MGKVLANAGRFTVSEELLNVADPQAGLGQGWARPFSVPSAFFPAFNELNSTHESHFGQIAECSDKCCASGSVPYFALPQTGGSFKHQPLLASHTRSCCSMLVRQAYSLQLPAALRLPESSLSVLQRMLFLYGPRDATSRISIGQAPIP